VNIAKGKILLIMLLTGLFCLNAVPQAGAWCFNNFTDLPIRFWVEDVHKATVGIRQTECWPGAYPGKGGARWITIHEISYPGDHSDKYWYVPVQVPQNGDATIIGGRVASQMSVEVTNDKGEPIYNGQLDGPFDTVKMP
jgi:hypothetical protein